MSVTKRNVLEQLSKQRPIELAQTLGIHLGVNKPKADFVDAIVRARRYAVADALNLPARDHHLSAQGRKSKRSVPFFYCWCL